jgi:hypothetical protein
MVAALAAFERDRLLELPVKSISRSNVQPPWEVPEVDELEGT